LQIDRLYSYRKILCRSVVTTTNLNENIFTRTIQKKFSLILISFTLLVFLKNLLLITENDIKKLFYRAFLIKSIRINVKKNIKTLNDHFFEAKQLTKFNVFSQILK